MEIKQLIESITKKGGFPPFLYALSVMSTYKLSALFFVLLLLGCNRKPELTDFSYTFSMENVNNFKSEFQLNPDSTYQINQYNYFFDNFEGKRRPLVKEGKLTTDEFNTFKKLIEGSRLNQMKDSYGFENPAKENNIIYMIQLTTGGLTKYVSVNADTPEKFPKDFTELIKYTSNFINK